MSTFENLFGDGGTTTYTATCPACDKKTIVTESGEDPPGFKCFDKPRCAWCSASFETSRHRSPFSIDCEKKEINIGRAVEA